MKTWFTSDTHFGHKNIIKYDETDFETIGEYDATLIERWNNVVRNDDIVYHLGDFAMTSNKDLLKEYFNRLNGRKRIILGNHDKCNISFYYEMGFERVYDKPVILKNFFILSHEPLYISPSMPYMNIFGHVHIHPAIQTRTKNSVCVCSCRHNYAPIRIPEWDNSDSEEKSNLLSF